MKIDRMILKFIWKPKEPRIVEAAQREVCRSRFPHIKPYYKVTIIETLGTDARTKMEK